jgi:hypothetical protein
MLRRKCGGFENERVVHTEAFENRLVVIIHSPQSVHFILLCYHRFEILTKLAMW